MGHCNITVASNKKKETKEKHIQGKYTRKDFTGYYFVKESFPRTRRGYPGEVE